MGSSAIAFLVFTLLTAHQVSQVTSSDPDPLQDFCVTDTNSNIFINGFPCRDPKSVIPQHFKTSVLRVAGNTSASPMGSSVTLTTPKNMPGLNTQGITFARTDIAGGGLVPPHVHPRASEIVFVIKGEVLVGFVDTSNKLFSQKLEEGDTFVFPRGLVHFLYNVGHSPVLTISGLNSQNPGASLIPMATFASHPQIPSQVLQKAFQISGHEVESIRKSLGG
eukprot:Gb_25391 [translate_table: standard]